MAFLFVDRVPLVLEGRPGLHGANLIIHTKFDLRDAVFTARLRLNDHDIAHHVLVRQADRNDGPIEADGGERSQNEDWKGGQSGSSILCASNHKYGNEMVTRW